MTLLARLRPRLLLMVAPALLSVVPLAIALASLSGIGHRWIDILAQFVGPALVMVAGLSVLAAALRLWPTLILTVAIGALLVTAGWPQWMPPRGRPASEVGFTLYSANVYAWNTDHQAIARSVQEADADLVVLIELGDTAAARVDQILPDHPYRLTSLRSEQASGPSVTVIAGRRPLTIRGLHLPRLHALIGEAETPIGPVTLAAVHLTRPWPYQYQWAQIIQAQSLIDWRRAQTGPVVVAGDFNSVSSARIGRMVRREAGLIAAPGWPGTWHSALPAWASITIDQVYRSPDLALVERRLGRPNGSDHRPVITRFVRAETPPTA